MLTIKTDLSKKDYQKLINKAKENILGYTSKTPTKIKIDNIKINGEIICKGIKIGDGYITMEGNYVPPILKFAFILEFESEDIDLVKKALENDNVLIDNNRYYTGDYQKTSNTFYLRFISYNLCEDVK